MVTQLRKPGLGVFAAWTMAAASSQALADTRIVLVGGPDSHGPGEHAIHDGIARFKAILDTSEDVRNREDIEIVAFPDGWPAMKDLEGTSTLVLYFDGLDVHPFHDAGRRAQMEELMKAGVGLVTIHQSSTIPADDKTIRMQEWLGAARYGMVDRTTETVQFDVADDHPIARGVPELILHDEFYPTIRFIEGQGQVSPILTGEMRTEDDPSERTRVAAWTYERAGGGRSFGFTGGHYLRTWESPDMRRLLMNAVFWTAGLEVPGDGVDVTVDQSVVVRPDNVQVLPQDWGRIEWYVSGPLGNSDTMTTGLAVIESGKSNPRHYHPNCDEVLTVLQGHIRHTMNDVTVEMKSGDTVSIPQGTRHNATNIGDEDAHLAISFSSAWREVVGE